MKQERKHIRLVIFASELHNNASVMGSRTQLFEYLRSLAEIEVIYPTMLQANKSKLSVYIDGGGKDKVLPHNRMEESRTVCFIATGGTEEIFRSYLPALGKPVILLSDGFHNSLAATMEISTFLANKGIERTVYNAPLDCTEEFCQNFIESIFQTTDETPQPVASNHPLPKFNKTCLRVLQKTKIGLIGGASSWLIASSINREAITKTYGAQFVDIELKELEKEFEATGDENPEVVKTVTVMSRYLAPDRSEKDLKEAARMYVALRSLCAINGLGALTIRCFGILKSCCTTACLALSLLNDEGIVCACEGDIPALWTMLYAKLELKKASFMANPSSSNRKELTVDFAHCTIPLSMVHGYRLPSHFESSIGIGIAGSVPSGRYRIMKFTGEKLDRFFSFSGEVIMNTNVPQRCRTQIRFKFDSEKDFDSFLSESKGNHVILV